MTDPGDRSRPGFSDDRQWWWSGSEWVPASQAPAATSPITVVIGIVLVVGFTAGLMFLVTTFLFAFSGGQYRMVGVVNYGVLAVIGTTLLITGAAWRLRSPVAALKWAAIATGVGWVAAVFVEWLLSLELGA